MGRMVSEGESSNKMINNALDTIGNTSPALGLNANPITASSNTSNPLASKMSIRSGYPANSNPLYSGLPRGNPLSRGRDMNDLMIDHQSPFRNDFNHHLFSPNFLEASKSNKYVDGGDTDDSKGVSDGESDDAHNSYDYISNDDNDKKRRKDSDDDGDNSDDGYSDEENDNDVNSFTATTNISKGLSSETNASSNTPNINANTIVGTSEKERKHGGGGGRGAYGLKGKKHDQGHQISRNAGSESRKSKRQGSGRRSNDNPTITEAIQRQLDQTERLLANVEGDKRRMTQQTVAMSLMTRMEDRRLDRSVKMLLKELSDVTSIMTNDSSFLGGASKGGNGGLADHPMLPLSMDSKRRNSTTEMGIGGRSGGEERSNEDSPFRRESGVAMAMTNSEILRPSQPAVAAAAASALPRSLSPPPPPLPQQRPLSPSLALSANSKPSNSSSITNIHISTTNTNANSASNTTNDTTTNSNNVGNNISSPTHANVNAANGSATMSNIHYFNGNITSHPAAMAKKFTSYPMLSHNSGDTDIPIANAGISHAISGGLSTTLFHEPDLLNAYSDGLISIKDDAATDRLLGESRQLRAHYVK